jgi:hypothetical protein
MIDVSLRSDGAFGMNDDENVSLKNDGGGFYAWTNDV